MVLSLVFFALGQKMILLLVEHDMLVRQQNYDVLEILSEMEKGEKGG